MPTGVFIRTESNSGGCFKNGVIPWNKGIKWSRGKDSQPRSEQWKKNLSESLKGRDTWNKGLPAELQPRWEGGKATITSRIRASNKYSNWRALVFRRDGWTCQTCGLRGHGKDIEAHHIKPIKEVLLVVDNIQDINERFESAMRLPELFSLDNGITLCKECHILTFKRRVK